MNAAVVYFRGDLAGRLYEMGEHFVFNYDPLYLAGRDPRPLSLTLPLQAAPFFSETLHPFFAGMLSEGALRKLQETALDTDKPFELLKLTAGSESIGCVTVQPDLS